jgi:phosphoribosylanthranilate isomerase
MIGVDHVGILVGNGEFPRELSVERAAEVAAEVLPPSRVSALFLTADLSAISKGVGELHRSIVHLGAAPELLSPGDVAALKIQTAGCAHHAKRAGSGRRKHCHCLRLRWDYRFPALG